MRYFDYERVASEAGIAEAKLRELCAMIRREFPEDDMMAELHILRACMVVRDGIATIEQVLHPEAAMMTL